MKVCLSLAPQTVAQAREMLTTVPHDVNLTELRTDWMHDPDIDALLRKPRPSLIVTNRSMDEGGGFNGRPADQHAMLSEICKAGAEYVDVELGWGIPFFRSLTRKHPRTKFILSHHNFKGTPKSLLPLYRRMRTAKPAIMKFATMARSVADHKAIIELLEQARRDKQPIIAFCMGEHGQATRILGGRWGATLTFGFDDRFPPTAPGQISVQALIKTFRVHIINRRTHIFGLVGNPVSQSRGIHVHNERFQSAGLDAVYVNFLADRFDSFLNTYGDIVSGISVTMPFKRDAAAAMNRFGDASRALGAVNTVLFNKGRMTGYNTDLTAVQSLLDKAIRLRRKHAVVLGTGAIARTMAYAAVHAGAHVTIVGRNAEAREQLAADLGCASAGVGELPSMRCDVLMNGTSVGMNGVGASLVPSKMLNRVKLVFEAVYVPEETTLVRQARKAGCKVITGMQMFVAQAEAQSKLFCTMASRSK